MDVTQVALGLTLLVLSTATMAGSAALSTGPAAYALTAGLVIVAGAALFVGTARQTRL